MKQIIESYINGITMYRLVTYGLVTIVIMSLLLSAVGVLQLSFGGMLWSLFILVAVSYGANRLFAWTFSTKYNRESGLITALILFLLLLPVRSTKDILIAALVAVIAVASKYVIVYRQRHIFNPAAVAVVISGVLGLVHAGWWVATPYLLPAVLIVGILVTWKVRHFAMVAVYLVAATATAMVVAIVNGYNINEELSFLFLSSPVIFAASIMLTEPFTTPATRKWQLVYAVFVGFLTTCQLLPFLTPEFAIVIGNLLVFILGQKGATLLEFVETKTLAPHTIEIIAKPRRRFMFIPGQYLELSIPHARQDSRGMRRTFSIASSPTDEYVRFGITLSEPSSSFKKALISLKQGEILRATRLGGDFILPLNIKEPILFIAGGIGITPFRSMLDDLIRRNETRDIVLIHAVRNEELLVYPDIIESAKKIGLTYIPIVAQPSEVWKGEHGIVTFEMVSLHAPDVLRRRIYLSGPSLMVSSVRHQLIKGGAARKKIVTDYFSGY
jgi:glycine betaine catabolism B